MQQSLHMADGAEDGKVNKSPSGAATSMLSLVLAILVAVVVSFIGIGGTAFWLIKSGRVPLGSPAKPEPTVKNEPAKSKLIPLDPLLVNLADPGGHAYLRIGIVLREEEPASPKEAKAKEAKDEKPEKGKPVINETDLMMRDAALNVVSHETAEALLSLDGKGRLKEELKKAMQEQVPETKILDVLFTDFLVQR